MRRTDLQDTALWARLAVIKPVRGGTSRERLEKTNALIVSLRELRRRADRELPSQRIDEDPFA